jgi:hypothetical protein
MKIRQETCLIVKGTPVPVEDLPANYKPEDDLSELLNLIGGVLRPRFARLAAFIFAQSETIERLREAMREATPTADVPPRTAVECETKQKRMREQIADLEQRLKLSDSVIARLEKQLQCRHTARRLRLYHVEQPSARCLLCDVELEPLNGQWVPMKKASDAATT